MIVSSMFYKMILALILILLIPASLQIEEFHEELLIKPLPNRYVNTYFQFSNRWKLEPGENLQNTNFFPLSIADILLQFDLKELHVSLTQGLWKYDSWGYPVADASPGAEIWAWFSNNQRNLTHKEIDSQWTHLVSTLSGLLCSSLNFVDKTNTIEPKYSFRPKSGTLYHRDNAKFIRYSSLPREIVCTENLTPWKKLLPCNSKYGLTSLLNSGYVHNTNYHSLSLNLRTICNHIYEKNCIIEFVQTANLVYDTRLIGGNSDFSLRRLFGQGLNGACVLAKSSKIYVDLSNPNYEIVPESEKKIVSLRGGSEMKLLEYDLKTLMPNQMFNINWVNKNPNIIDIIPAPLITVNRYILGRGQERAQIVSQIKNTHWAAVNIVYMENIPWYVPCYIHTLKIKSLSNAMEIKPNKIYYIPGQQRERAYQLEIALTIPPKSTIEISFDFDYIFLKWIEYPPDANHGHYLGSAVLSTSLPLAKNYSSIPIEGCLLKDSFNASCSSYFLQIRTESLILSLPTPDFSMPYNVICLACTVVALAFGPIHSVATKKIIIEKNLNYKSILGKIKSKFFKGKTNELNKKKLDEQINHEIK